MRISYYVVGVHNLLNLWYGRYDTSVGSEVEVPESDEGKIHCRQWISTYDTLL
jgi:hypothetical protein